MDLLTHLFTSKEKGNRRKDSDLYQGPKVSWVKICLYLWTKSLKDSPNQAHTYFGRYKFIASKSFAAISQVMRCPALPVAHNLYSQWQEMSLEKIILQDFHFSKGMVPHKIHISTKIFVLSSWNIDSLTYWLLNIINSESRLLFRLYLNMKPHLISIYHKLQLSIFKSPYIYSMYKISVLIYTVICSYSFHTLKKCNRKCLQWHSNMRFTLSTSLIR